MRMRIFRSDKMADYAFAVQCWNHSSLATERFQIKPLEISARKVSHIVCETNEHWKSEMLSNGHTDPTTVTLMCAEG